MRSCVILILFLTLAPGPARGDDTLEVLTRELHRALREDRDAAVLKIVEGLLDQGTVEAVDTVLDRAFDADSYLVDESIRSWVEKLGDAALLRHLLERATGHPDSRVRITLVRALGPRPEPEAYGAVVAGLFDRSHAVVVAAIDALAARRSWTCVKHIIHALELQEARQGDGELLAHEMGRLLTRLTGETRERALDWRSWWQVHGPGFRGPESATPRTTPGHSGVVSRRKAWEIEIPSRRVLFVMDVSSSMDIKDPAPATQAAGTDPPRRRPRTGVGSGTSKDGAPRPGPTETPGSRMRIRRVQSELVRVIHELEPDVEFNIVCFNDRVRVWRPGGLVQATRANRAAAARFVRDFSPRGQTHTDEALEAAFALPGARTMVLLSDGAPRRDNRALSTNRIVQWVREANRHRQVRLHTVGFEQVGGTMRRFLRALADATGGEYRELR